MPCNVSYAGAGVSCGTIKQAFVTAAKDVGAASKGIASVPGALFGTNPNRSLFASALGTAPGAGFSATARGTA
jgi:hypothetical protein